MKCPKCGAELKDGVKFCQECGTKIEVAQPVKQFCRECGNEIPAGAKFCPYCGADIHFIDKIKAENATSGNTKGQFEKVENNSPEKTKGQSENVSFGSKVKTKASGIWNHQDIFCKIIIISIAVVIIFLLISIFAYKTLATVISVIQLGGLVTALLMHKGKIRTSKKWLKYIVLAASIMLIVLNVMAYTNGLHRSSSTNTANDIKTNSVSYTPHSSKNTNNSTSSVSTASKESSSKPETLNNTIEKGTKYAYMSDEWNVYIATAISDSVIKIENWDKTLSSDLKVEYKKDIGTYKINDSVNGFSWIDDDHTAFNFNLQDFDNSERGFSRTAVSVNPKLGQLLIEF
jgi:hypothetical protein